MMNGFSSVLTIVSAANGFSYGAEDIVRGTQQRMVPLTNIENNF